MFSPCTLARPRPRQHAWRAFFSSSARRASPKLASHPIAGTVPEHHGYLILHTTRPPATWPARIASPVQSALLAAARTHGVIANFAWSPHHRHHPSFSGLGRDVERGDVEAYAATAFRAGLRFDVPEVSLATVDTVLQRITHGEPDTNRRVHLYVCTHAARDCRCGDTGGAVARALRAEIARRGLGEGDVALSEIAHVGGHKYAANLLVFPSGDWLGSVLPEDVPGVLDAILANETDSGGLERGVTGRLWRGRMGLSPAEQTALAASASSDIDAGTGRPPDL